MEEVAGGRFLSHRPALDVASCYYQVPNATVSEQDQSSVFSNYIFYIPISELSKYYFCLKIIIFSLTSNHY